MDARNHLFPGDALYPPPPPIPMEAGTIPGPPPLPTSSSAESLQTRLTKVAQAYHALAQTFVLVAVIGGLKGRMDWEIKMGRFSSQGAQVVLAVLAGLAFVVFLFREMKLAVRLRWSWVAVAALLFPPWSVIGLFILHKQTMKLFREHGVPVGLFGPTLENWNPNSVGAPNQSVSITTCPQSTAHLDDSLQSPESSRDQADTELRADTATENADLPGCGSVFLVVASLFVLSCVVANSPQWLVWILGGLALIAIIIYRRIGRPRSRK
jgi:hypothetical protein